MSRNMSDEVKIKIEELAAAAAAGAAANKSGPVECIDLLSDSDEDSGAKDCTPSPTTGDLSKFSVWQRGGKLRDRATFSKKRPHYEVDEDDDVPNVVTPRRRIKKKTAPSSDGGANVKNPQKRPAVNEEERDDGTLKVVTPRKDIAKNISSSSNSSTGASSTEEGQGRKQDTQEVQLTHEVTGSNSETFAGLHDQTGQEGDGSNDDDSLFSSDDETGGVGRNCDEGMSQGSKQDAYSLKDSHEDTGRIPDNLAVLHNQTGQEGDESNDDGSLFSSDDETGGIGNRCDEYVPLGGKSNVCDTQDMEKNKDNVNESNDDDSLFPSGDENGDIDNQCDDEAGVIENHCDGNESVGSRFSYVEGEGEWGSRSVAINLPPPKKKSFKPMRPNTLVCPKSYPKVWRDCIDDSYFSLKWGDDILITETHTCNGLPKKEVGDEYTQYEIFYFELVERKNKGGKQFNQDRMGKCYFRSFYRRKSKGLSLAYELSRIANFEALTYKDGPHKTASRLKLLACAACRMPLPKGKEKSRVENCIHELEADMFEIIPDNGHLGCGFVPVDFLQVRILGNSAGANRASAIQVRIVGPLKIGVAKGMLFAKEGIDKIQIPTSMIKVGPSKLNKAQMLHTNVVLIVKQIFPSEANILRQRLLNPSHPNFHTFKQPPSKESIEELEGLTKTAKHILGAKGCPSEIIQQYEDEHRLNHASLVGVTDPTGCIPEGHVFLTGSGHDLPEKVFICVSPGTEASDGIIVPIANASNFPAHTRSFLEDLSIGAVIFAQGAQRSLIPTKMDDGDCDGDLYFVITDPDIVFSMEDRTTPAIEVFPDDDHVVGTEFQKKIDGYFRPAVVIKKIALNLYLVESDVRATKVQFQMTKEEIEEGTYRLKEVIGHCPGKQSHPTKFHLKHEDGKEEWLTMREIRAEWSYPPEEIIEYAHGNGLLEEDGPKDCKWLKNKLGSSVLLKIKGHRVRENHIEVLCEYDCGIEEWEPLKEVKKDGKLQVAQYAYENSLFKQRGWRSARDYWLRAVQDMFCNENRSSEIGGLVKMLHGKFKKCNKQHGPNHEDTITWGKAYKQANDLEKQGKRVTLPFAYHRQVPEKWQNYIGIA